MDLDLQQAAEQEAQQAAEQQPDNQPSEKPDVPETLQEAMFGGGGEEPPEPEADAPAEDATPQEPEPHKDGAAAKPDEKSEPDDLAEPEGLGEKASARFQALANEVKEYRAKEGDYQQMAETVQEFQRLAQESCNNAEEVTDLFDYAKAVKTGDYDKVEQYLKQQIVQFEAISGRSLTVDLLSQFPDLQQQAEEMTLDPKVAHELAQARWRQQQQQQYAQQSQQAQQAQWQQQQQAAQAEQQRQAEFNQAVQDVNELSMQYAKSDVLWPEFEPKVLAFAKNELSQMPPNQWKFALQTFYNGLKQAANPVRQKVQPLRGGMPAGGAADPQNLQEAMFGGM